MIDLVIFDCDGVLVDSEILSADVMIDELADLGIHIDRAYVRQRFLGRSWPTVVKAIRAGFDVPLPEDFEQRYRTSLLARFETDLKTTNGIEEVLAGMTLPFCVATSSSPPRVARSLAITGLDKYFTGRVFTASQVQNGKPAPDLFLFAASQLGATPARTLVIEDSLPGLTAAQAAQMPHLAYAGASHLRGMGVVMPEGVPAFDNWADFPQLLSNFSQRNPT